MFDVHYIISKSLIAIIAQCYHCTITFLVSSLKSKRKAKSERKPKRGGTEIKAPPLSYLSIFQMCIGALLLSITFVLLKFAVALQLGERERPYKVSSLEGSTRTVGCTHEFHEINLTLSVQLYFTLHLIENQQFYHNVIAICKTVKFNSLINNRKTKL